MRDLNQYKLPMTPELGSALNIFTDIAAEEDKRIFKLINDISEDINFVNEIELEDLPLYINYEFKTAMGSLLVTQRIKTRNKIEDISDIVKDHIDELIKG